MAGEGRWKEQTCERSPDAPSRAAGGEQQVPGGVAESRRSGCWTLPPRLPLDVLRRRSWVLPQPVPSPCAQVLDTRARAER